MAGQFGLKTEAVWSTPVTVDKFFEPDRVTQNVDEGWLRPAGKRGGRRLQRPPKPGARTIGGQMSLSEFPNTGGIATFLKHFFGAVVTSGVGPYTHTYSLGSAASFTAQVGIEDEGGTVRPFTHVGCLFGSGRIASQVGQFAMIEADWTAQDVGTGTALAAAAYAAELDPFTFVETTLTLDGADVLSARGVDLRFGKALKTNRHRLGSRLIRRQREEGKWPIGGSIDADFEDLDLIAAMVAADELELGLLLDNGTDTFEITATGSRRGSAPSL